MKTFIVAVALALAGAAAVAAEPSPHAHGATGVDANAKAGRSCFRTSEIRGHKFGDDNSIYVRAGGKDVFRLETTGRCVTGHMRNDPLVIDPAPPNGLVCQPIDLSLKIGDPSLHMAPTPCIVRGMRKLTPAEVSALPPKLRP